MMGHNCNRNRLGLHHHIYVTGPNHLGPVHVSLVAVHQPISTGPIKDRLGPVAVSPGTSLNRSYNTKSNLLTNFYFVLNKTKKQKKTKKKQKKTKKTKKNKKNGPASHVIASGVSSLSLFVPQCSLSQRGCPRTHGCPCVVVPTARVPDVRVPDVCWHRCCCWCSLS